MPSLTTHLVLHATLRMGVATHLEHEPCDEVSDGIATGEEQCGGVPVDLERGSWVECVCLGIEWQTVVVGYLESFITSPGDRRNFELHLITTPVFVCECISVCVMFPIYMGRSPVTHSPLSTWRLNTPASAYDHTCPMCSSTRYRLYLRLTAVWENLCPTHPSHLYAGEERGKEINICVSKHNIPKTKSFIVPEVDERGEPCSRNNTFIFAFRRIWLMFHKV